MDKIILNDNTTLNFSLIENTSKGLTLTFIDKTIAELEIIMIKDNLTKISLANENGKVYAVYNNLTCNNIAKKLVDGTVTVDLYELSDTEIKLNELQTTLDALVTTNLGV